tara:strand:+ start:19075 stop:19752 length:678 start_codon:yes stop_codon:yes gene_type:complete
MANRIEISVLIAAYNQEKYIGRCLRSILNQSLDPLKYEVNLVNDGSTDRTLFAAELFCDPKESRINIINNNKNLGLPASINKAIIASKGKYVVRIDSDDWVSRDFLKLLYTYLENNNYMDAIACDYNLVDKNEKVIQRKNCFEDPIACGIMFKRNDLIQIGLYDENFHCHEDRDLRIRFEQKFNISRLELPLYRYRKHENNMTNNQKVLDEYNNKLISKYGSDFL